VLSDRQKEALGTMIQGVRQKRAQDSQTAMQMKHDTGKAVLAANSKTGAAGSKPKAATAGGAKAGAKVPKAAITPYLTSPDLMEVSNMTSAAENTDRQARHSFQQVAAEGGAAIDDIGRSWQSNVAGANDDAAARGLYDSGIREGNVGMANANASRQALRVRDTVGLALQQQAATRAAAKSQLASQLSVMAGRAAENGMALPVDPYAATPGQGSNVKGAQTTRKTSTKRRTGLSPSARGKAVLR